MYEMAHRFAVFRGQVRIQAGVRSYLASNWRWTTPLGSENSIPRAFSRLKSTSTALEATAAACVTVAAAELEAGEVAVVATSDTGTTWRPTADVTAVAATIPEAVFEDAVAADGEVVALFEAAATAAGVEVV